MDQVLSSMDLLSAVITFGGAILCMFVPVFLFGAILVFLAPRISGFFSSGKTADGGK
jgi:hypothetical protein